MATSTELLRAAEHMRHQGALMLEDERWHVGTSYCEAADMLEREAKHLQAVEAQQPKRSWPEGWPPFAVLRRAYLRLGLVEPTPSVLDANCRCESLGALLSRQSPRALRPLDEQAGPRPLWLPIQGHCALTLRGIVPFPPPARAPRERGPDRVPQGQARCQGVEFVVMSKNWGDLARDMLGCTHARDHHHQANPRRATPSPQAGRPQPARTRRRRDDRWLRP